MYSFFSIMFLLCFSDSSVGKESACNAGDPGSTPGLGRSLREGKVFSLQYSGLENSMDCIVHGVPESQTQLNSFHFHLSFHQKGRIQQAKLRIRWL